MRGFGKLSMTSSMIYVYFLRAVPSEPANTMFGSCSINESHIALRKPRGYPALLVRWNGPAERRGLYLSLTIQVKLAQGHYGDREVDVKLYHKTNKRLQSSRLLLTRAIR